ncbi:pilus assembly protein [Roseomonas eburnea]|uniref:Pilus assembly protein n=1 Tax=Neoroseomonas eburnea TaxID=1346889 RepID=A0A9X9XFJ9_9PROT|nr:TadE family protein [Neoroseomonas eburnea]MBR0682485.1 pilus assembly protein [Neoroseomonas eburnea]
MAATEFALIAVPFFFMVMACMETAWQLATGAALDHAALRASRYGITGDNAPPGRVTEGQENVPVCRSDNIRWMIVRATNGMIKDNSDLTVVTEAWGGVSGAGGGSGAEGAGSGGQIVSYTITYDQPFISGGIAASFWGGNSIRHRAFLMVKNEPFENETC